MSTDLFHSRQEFFCPVDNIKSVKALVVGCGAIGRNVASNIARLGVGDITLVDDDHIEAHNIVPQNWRLSQCGKPKVEILADEILDQMSDGVKLTVIPAKWTPRAVGPTTEYDAVWTTVDNITVRKMLYQYYSDKCKMFFDVRIGRTIAQIFTIEDMKTSEDWYSKTFFDESERSDFGCVQPMSNYLANIAAGISVAQFVNIMGGKKWPVHRMLQYCAISTSLSKVNPDEYFAEM